METKLYNYDFIFSDIYGHNYEVVHLKNVSANEYTRKIEQLKLKYRVGESTILLKWFK